MAPLIFFCRHGQTDWNAESRLQGQWDTDLNDTGRSQVDRNGRKLARVIGASAGQFDFVASPLSRTRETMERIRAGMGLVPGGYRTDSRLKEICFGDWESHTFAELERIQPGITAEREADKWNFVAPGANGESYAMLCERVRAWLATVERPTVCVAHGGVMRCIFRIRTNLSESDAASMSIPQDRILRAEDARLEWL